MKNNTALTDLRDLEIERRIRVANYELKYYGKWPDLRGADTKMLPSDIDDILESLDR